MLLGVVLLALPCQELRAEVTETPAMRRVLVINSYHPGYLWSDEEMKGLFEVLRSKGGLVDLHVEYMDWRRFPTAENRERLQEFYREKYAREDLELIIAVDNPALDFAIQTRPMFGDPPIVFCGINGIERIRLTLPQGITGVAEALDVKGTLADAFALQPRATDVLVIVDTTETGKILRQQIAEALAPYAGRARIQYASDVNVTELGQAIEAVPAEGFILLGTFHRDREGRFIGSEEIVEIVTSRAHVPTYHLWDFGMGRGVVGGNLLGGEYQGQRAGTMALEILAGRKASTIPIDTRAPAPPTFDDRELERFAIPTERLPAGSRVLFRPVSFYSRYRLMIWLAVVLLAAKATAIVLLAVNVHRRKKAEAAMALAKQSAEDANRAKDHFLAVLSHELRTPLTPILLTVEELHSDAELSEEVRAQLLDVRRNAELEARLIDDLLDISRITAGKLQLRHEKVDVHAAISSVARIMENDAAGKQVALSTDLTAGEHYVSGDLGRLEQVFWNLLKNAIKFTPEGGTIQIRTYNEPEAPGEAREAPPRERIVAQVRDSGMGIEPAILPKLFGMFQQGTVTITQRFGGLGIGLAITKVIVDRHEGIIEASSEGIGKGSTFTVKLPTVVAPIRVARPAALPRRLEAEAMQILLVEDNEPTGRVLVRLLQRAGYKVNWARTLASGRKALIENHFDVLLSDIGLPDGSGTELGPLCVGASAPYGIALSGLGMEQDVAASKAAGFRDHLVKPVTLSALELAIARAGIHEPGTEGGSTATNHAADARP